MKHFRRKLFLPLVMLVSVVGSFITASKPVTVSASSPTLLSSTVLGHPSAAGHIVVWSDNRNQSASVYAYDLLQQREFLVSNTSDSKNPVVTDGFDIAWIQSSPTGAETLYNYNLQSGQTRPILGENAQSIVSSSSSSLNPYEFGGIAVSNGVLYYQGVIPGHSGLYSYNLTTNQEQLIAIHGINPVTSDGTLIWSEQVNDVPSINNSNTTATSITNTIDITDTSRILSTSNWELHMLKVDGSVGDTVIVNGQGCFSGYNVSGNNIVWAFNCAAADNKAYIYNITTRTTAVAADKTALNPVVNGTKVIWTGELSTLTDQPATWDIESVNISNTSQSSLITSVNVLSSTVRTEAVALLNQNMLAFTVEGSHSQSTVQLYVVDTTTPVPGFNYEQSNSVTVTGCSSQPINCPQITVRTNNRFLYEGTTGYAWPVDGVQLFNPDMGINGATFYPMNYQTAAGLGYVDYWLSLASGDLVKSKTVRIFVDLPGDANQYTQVADLMDFANKANARGMRIALVMHNNNINSWTMTAEKRVWINQFISTFVNSNKKQLIAYVSADNEINNYCRSRVANIPGTRKIDNGWPNYNCYDWDVPMRNGQLWQPSQVNGVPTATWPYIDAANRWVKDFTDIFKQSGSGILTTVGISTEMDRGPAMLPVENSLFRQTKNGVRPLAELVDFISVHNYGGGASSVKDNVYYRFYNAGYIKPMVLEEYGYPTDPLPKNPRYTEGQDPRGVCITDPLHCTSQRGGDAAPRLIELNTKFMRDSQTYAGGSAWMLFDVSYANCGGGSTFDFFTGLFAGPGTYCGGTVTSNGQPKNTSLRVKRHHELWQPQP